MNATTQAAESAALGAAAGAPERQGGHFDVLIAGSEIALERGSRIGRDALIAGRSVDVRGSVGGELTVYAQQVVIAGAITGKVRLVAEDIELLDGARIGGTLSYTSPNEIKRSAGAQVEGEVTRREPQTDAQPQPSRETDDGAWGLLGALLWALGLFLFGVVLHWTFPVYATEAARRALSDHLAALGLGFALLIATPIAAGLAIVTIVGIPLGASALALYPVLLLAGYLTGVSAVAQRLRQSLGPRTAPSGVARLLWLAVTLVVLLVIGLVPFLGWLISAWVLLAGMGGLTLAARARHGGTHDEHETLGTPGGQETPNRRGSMEPGGHPGHDVVVHRPQGGEGSGVQGVLTRETPIGLLGQGEHVRSGAVSQRERLSIAPPHVGRSQSLQILQHVERGSTWSQGRCHGTDSRSDGTFGSHAIPS
jgi:hypothetical protein